MWRCRYNRRLMPYAEGALDQASAEEVKRHIDSCARCREELSLLTSAVQALRMAEAPAPMEPAADIWGRIRSEIEEKPVRAPLWRVRSYQAASAAVIGTTLLFFALVRPMYQPQIGDVARKYSVTPPKVAENTQPTADQMSGKAITPGKPLERSGRPKDLSFMEPPEAARPSVAVPVPSEFLAKPPGTRAVEEPRPLPPSDHRQTQGVPGGSQIARLPAPPSSASNVSGGGQRDFSQKTTLGNSWDYADTQVSTAPTAQAERHTEQRADTRGGGVKASGSLSAQGGMSISAGDSDSIEGAAADTYTDKAGHSRVAPIPKPSAKTVVLTTQRSEYMKRLQKHPNDAPAIYELAKVEQKLGNKTAVLALRKRLTELRPKQASLWVELGEAYEANGQPRQAYQAYNNALSLGLKGNASIEVGKRVRRLGKQL